MSTYTKIFIICPHCNSKTDSSISHLETGTSFGPWYCNICGGGYKGKANGAQTQVIKTEGKFIKTVDLLVIPPQTKPIYFVMYGMQHQSKDDVGKDIDFDNMKFYYEEHSCPTNWIGDAQLIAVGNDTDPHGLLEYVRSVIKTEQFDGTDEDDVILETFPEILRNTEQ